MEKVKKLMLKVSVVCFLLGSFAFAQNQPEILPDVSNYHSKRQIEKDKLKTCSDPVERTKLHIKFAEERLAEAKAMISEGKREFLETLIKDYEESIDEAMNEIENAEEQGKDTKDVLKVVENATKKHIEVLQELLEKVPEPGKKGICRAIEASQKGRERALEALRKRHHRHKHHHKHEDKKEYRERSKSEEVEESAEKDEHKKKGKPEGVERPGSRFGGKR